VSEAETMAEVEALEAPFRTLYGPPGAGIDDACFEVLLVAEANGTTLDLFCQDDE